MLTQRVAAAAAGLNDWDGSLASFAYSVTTIGWMKESIYCGCVPASHLSAVNY